MRNYQQGNGKVVTKKENDQAIPSYIQKGIKDITDYFGHKVVKKGKGTINIPFHSEEDFNRITKLVKREK